MPSVGVQDHLDHPSLEARLVRWLDHRLRESAPSGSAVQLYGLEVIDVDRIDELHPAAVRTVFVCAGRDERDVLDHPDAWRAFEFDATAIVRSGWVLVPSASTRPGAHPRRERGFAIDLVTHS